MHPENLDRAAAYIRAQFAKTKAQVREQEYEVNGRRYRNIIARFGGDENLIVAGAHYDGCNDTPGADDNASGVAGLLELATLLDRHPTGRMSSWSPTPSRNLPFSERRKWAAPATRRS